MYIVISLIEDVKDERRKKNSPSACIVIEGPTKLFQGNVIQPVLLILARFTGWQSLGDNNPHSAHGMVLHENSCLPVLAYFVMNLFSLLVKKNARRCEKFR